MVSRKRFGRKWLLSYSTDLTCMWKNWGKFWEASLWTFFLVWDFNHLCINLTGEDGLYTRSTKQDMPWVRWCRLMLLATVREQITYISMTLTSSWCMVSRNHILLPLRYALNWCLFSINIILHHILHKSAVNTLENFIRKNVRM